MGIRLPKTKAYHRKMFLLLHPSMDRIPRLTKHISVLLVGEKSMAVEEFSFQPVEHCTSAN